MVRSLKGVHSWGVLKWATMCDEIAYEGKCLHQPLTSIVDTNRRRMVVCSFPFPRLPPFARKASYQQHKLQTTIFNVSLSKWISCYNTLNGDQI